jgi:hypothetical protein
MQTDWFSCFSMAFWAFTKVAGLFMALFGLQMLAGLLQHGFHFWTFLFLVITPLVLAYVLLVTEIVFDLATAEMRRRQSVAK